MIGQYTLMMLCEKYGISSDKLVNKNNNILTYGEYKDIDSTLNYLVNILKISSNNIEKCPSILYRRVDNIKDNVNFIKNCNIHFSNIESCLHVLSSEPFELKMTYEYVKENYGLDIINRITSILSVPKDIIKNVEKLNIPFINKNGNLSVAVGIKWDSTNLEEIQKIIQSPEFKEHPELFTSQTLAHAKLEEIQKIIQSPEFKEHPEMFTSTTLAQIQELLQMDCWNDKRYSSLLTSSIVAKSKSMISKLQLLFRLAEENNIDGFLNTSFLLFSPSQNYALIQYLKENNLPLIIDDKLNPIFGKQPGLLKKKYNIDIKELIQKYTYEEDAKKINGGISK